MFLRVSADIGLSRLKNYGLCRTKADNEKNLYSTSYIKKSQFRDISNQRISQIFPWKYGQKKRKYNIKAKVWSRELRIKRTTHYSVYDSVPY